MADEAPEVNDGPDQHVVPFTVVNHEDEAGDPPVEVAEATPEKPAEPAKLEAPKRLAELRKEDGSFDEDRIERVVQDAEKAVKTWNHFDSLVAKDPELKKAILKSLKKTGYQLSPEDEKQISEPVAAPVVLTREQKRAKFQEIQLSKGDYEAYEWLKSVDIDPAFQSLKAKEEAEAQRAAQAQLAQQSQAQIKHFNGEYADAAKAYPELIKANPQLPYGYEIVDPVVLAKVRELPAGAPIKELVDIALFRLGRNKPKPKTTTVPVVRAAAITPPRPVAGPGEYQLKVTRG